MRIAPGAQPDDGLLWITVIESGSKLKMMTKVLPKVAAGKHLNERGFHFFPTDRIEIESDVPAVIDVDGEMAGAATRATISIVPKAIRIVTSDRSA